ncbi:hypothetical protein NL676_036597 [Syzygium grande]|nr:hypothetical protein NL676_036597 [Syzygium grande]
MARHISPCSSSSSSASAISLSHASSSELHKSLDKFLVLPRRTQEPSWVSRIRSRNSSRKSFQLKSSNGHSPSSVSLHDGSSLAKEHFKANVQDGLSPVNSESEKSELTYSITVVGASGDLAKKKIFPAIFALFYEDCLPKNFTVFGYARTKMTDEELRTMISRTLTCRIDKRELDIKLKEKEAGKLANRLFYLSIPPNIFVDVVRCASITASSTSGWTRVIVEKPFGRDSESSGELTRCLKQYLNEDQIFRIDHYLGKELVENLSVLRFSNLVFEPLWSRTTFAIYNAKSSATNIGTFAMETPVSLDAEDIRNEKVKVLRSMRPLQLEDVIVGQYKGHSKGDKSLPGYTDDPTVPKDSLTPTFAAAALFINNARWDGVPFLMKAGKGLHTKRAEIRVQFRHVPGNLDLNLLFKARYPREIPDAYERLLLDAIEGERRLFIRSDELDAAWALFTPLLKELEEKKIVPELYPYSSRGPVGAHYLAAKHNVRWGMSAVRTHEMMRSSGQKFKAGTSSFLSSSCSIIQSLLHLLPQNKRREAIFLRCSHDKGMVLSFLLPKGSHC